MDGWITIGTKIDEGKFDKQLADLDRKIALQEKRKDFFLCAGNDIIGE